MYLLKKLFHPEVFQGKYKRKNYFEGWYYKIIDSSMRHALAVIPGISLGGGRNDSHAFIQILDASVRKVHYVRYDISSFRFHEQRFEIGIGDNRFSERELRLNISDRDLSIAGDLTFSRIVPFPKTILSPGIMGPFSFVPFMECHHGIVSIHHEIGGQLNLSGNPVDFGGGYGYIEKDWGSSFPEAWIWLQSNHFSPDDVSLMFSTARIPWLGRHFMGFLSFLRVGGRIYRFSTYSRAKIIRLGYNDNRLNILVQDKNFSLEIDAEHSEGGILKAPKNGLMDREVMESIDAAVTVRLTDNTGKTVFEGRGGHTGLEITADIFQYFSVE